MNISLSSNRFLPVRLGVEGIFLRFPGSSSSWKLTFFLTPVSLLLVSIMWLRSYSSKLLWMSGWLLLTVLLLLLLLTGLS